MSFNNLLLLSPFYSYKNSILFSLHLADFSFTLSLKLIMFSVINFSTPDMAKAERCRSTSQVLPKPKFLILVFSAELIAKY